MRLKVRPKYGFNDFFYIEQIFTILHIPRYMPLCKHAASEDYVSFALPWPRFTWRNQCAIRRCCSMFGLSHPVLRVFWWKPTELGLTVPVSNAIDSKTWDSSKFWSFEYMFILFQSFQCMFKQDIHGVITCESIHIAWFSISTRWRE